jgi:CHAD domain-containing protein
VPGAEVVHDSVAVLDGQRVTRSFDELEIELLEGDEKTLRRLEKALRRAGAGDAERRPKVFQALDLEYQPGPAEPAEGAPPGEAVRAMLRLQLERMLLRDPGTRLGTDPEELHQLRVATRRLRAYLRAAGPLLGAEWSEAVGEELRWAAAELGRVRDLDVMLEHFGEEIAALDPADRKAAAPFLRRLRGQRTSARRALLVALASERYCALLDRLEAGPPESPADEPTLTAIWEREFRKLRRTMRALGPESPDGELHAARIRAKKARYAAELAAPELGRACAELVKGAKALQDVLGEHQDAVVAEERIRAFVAKTSAPASAFAAGRLVERQRARRAASRREWPGAWARLERQGRRARR